MGLDTQLFYFFNNFAGQSAFMDGLIVFFGSYLAYVTLAAFLVLVYFSRSSNRQKLEWLLVAGASGLIARFGVTELIRLFIHRPRPFLTLPVHQLLTDSAWSFPSGHATFFFALAMAVYLYNRRAGWWFFAAAALISLGRVAAGIHYPLDVFIGAVIGVLVAWVVTTLVKKHQKAPLSSTH